ncbi:acetyl-CoA carboxylase biotin carboxyl carrier protein subunit [Actinophytocola sp.]|uniref:acetyl-CoA carboxylase biotin carboxyl carrier protein n=1 Tax=Actinophytocola sp. TaxID=1872138 RepID=UPI002D80928B|nr:acetyl-CoA carboxylase biotin carboxyl carrier protein subunit [Actinophytocola sp.]HET9141269.1 acetyl-CoA carboxylase biotin carboxyl carrier protein subunit [Actinophytocola sp.]
MSSYRVPRALQNGFDEHPDHEVIELRHNGLDEVLAAVRQTAVELLAAAPQSPSTLTVRAGTVAVEMTWETAAAATTVPGAVLAPPVAATIDAGGGNILAASTVGVFYRSASPGAAPFVKEGDHVVPGQQVAIIEAMKLMLPVEADRPGEVVEILVADGESVEFGQPLFRLAAVEA